MTSQNKQEIISFKADASLVEALRGVPNRSDFIRRALLAAINGACPLCNGTGILTPEQRTHWDEFIDHHSVEVCEECNATRLICDAVGSSRKTSGHTSRRKRRDAQ